MKTKISIRDRMASKRWIQTVHSDGSEEFVQPSHCKIGDEVTFRLRMDRRSPVEKVIFRSVSNGQEQAVAMSKEKEVGHLAYYFIRFKIWTSPFHYRFKILTANKIYHLNALGLHSYIPPDKDDFRICADFVPPSWLWGRIFYQIFPDRFFDGDPATNVRDGEYEYQGHKTIARKWGEPPGDYPHAFNLDFFGGDLKGIQQKIPYLKQLGVNALWLNPIFLSPSNHKYDTQDYHRIDPHIGSDQDLMELVKAVHRDEIRIILDGVFNHTGSCHLWFNRDGFYGREGTWQNPDSPFAEYYLSFGPKKYHFWAGFSSLPTLNYKSQKLRDEIYRLENSVAQKYVRPPFLMDGWRLDVADTLGRQDETQVHHQVWPEFRKSVKEANSEAYIMGECGTDASELLQGNELDGAMNYYGFAIPIRQWLSGQVVFEPESNENRSLTIDSKDLDVWLRRARSISPYPVILSMYNLLGSHDCTRIFHHLSRNENRLKLAFAFLITYVGVPAIYYGDEVGLSGGSTNESARGCMEWDEKKWNREIFKFVQTLVSIRKNSAALQRGGIVTLYSDENIYSFARFLLHENWIVVLNNNPTGKKVVLDCSPLALSANCRMRDILTETEFSCKDHFLTVNMKPYSALLLSDYKNS